VSILNESLEYEATVRLWETTLAASQDEYQRYFKLVEEKRAREAAAAAERAERNLAQDALLSVLTPAFCSWLNAPVNSQYLTTGSWQGVKYYDFTVWVSGGLQDTWRVLVYPDNWFIGSDARVSNFILGYGCTNRITVDR
jgi:hypothetical protein